MTASAKSAAGLRAVRRPDIVAGPERISIVINNFNYARYLPAAIDSALAQDHAPTEVVVVDDGSTDDSREVISRYADRLHPVYKENGGMASALNAGFRASTGEIVIFLDADDYLQPSAASEVALAWTATCAKVQYRLSVVDHEGRYITTDPPPGYPLPSGDMVPALLGTGRYTTPVTTGNAYGRAVLEQVMPIPEEEFALCADGYLNAVCPFYGEVVSLDEELGNYRQHGSNRWAFSGTVTASGLRTRIEHDLHRMHSLRQAAESHGYTVPSDLLFRDVGHVMARLSLLRFDRSQYPVATDAPRALTRAGLAAIKGGPPTPGLERAFCQAYLITLGVLPGPLARPVVRLVLSTTRKPRWARWGAGMARRAQRAGERLRRRRGT